MTTAHSIDIPSEGQRASYSAIGAKTPFEVPICSPCLHIVFVATVSLALAACSRPGPAAMVPPDLVVRTTSTKSATLKVSVEQMVSMGYSFLEADDLERAIQTAIEQSHLFGSVSTREGATADLALEVDAQLHTPTGGPTMTAVMTGAWRLRDARSARVLSERLVETSGTAGMGDAISALTRTRIAIERAAKKFIRAGIEVTSRAAF